MYRHETAEKLLFISTRMALKGDAARLSARESCTKSRDFDTSSRQDDRCIKLIAHDPIRDRAALPRTKGLGADEGIIYFLKTSTDAIFGCFCCSSIRLSISEVESVHYGAFGLAQKGRVNRAHNWKDARRKTLEKKSWARVDTCARHPAQANCTFLLLAELQLRPWKWNSNLHLLSFSLPENLPNFSLFYCES